MPSITKPIETHPQIDYKAIGLTIGLELHQQLNTTSKLFCSCPCVLRETPPHFELLRQLRPTQSELGEIDRAALFEFQKGLGFIYEGYEDITCLVEQDEEPPHALNPEALDVTLTVSELLHSDIVDEVHVMRKIVIDGSNTGGFQRTCTVSLGGEILDPSFGRVGIQSISLEEDAARKMEGQTDSGWIRYRLDRLGVPLIEIATDPDIHDPSDATRVAEKIGLLLRSTRKVKRGQGTIRQDLNVSIKDGAIIEIKGVQRLDLIQKTIEYEARRQYELLELKKELERRGVVADMFDDTPQDITELYASSPSKVIKTVLQKQGRVFGLRLRKFDGLVGRQLQPGRRLGTELADYARFYGRIPGLFHTDELPAYGITQEDVDLLRHHMKAETDDAVVLIAGKAQDAIKALKAVQDRAKELLRGVPRETRAPKEDGTTSFSRPRPGSARMYPETDVAPVAITKALRENILRTLPESLETKKDRFITAYGLSPQVALQMVSSLQLDLFETVMERFRVPASIVAATLLETWKSLSRDGVPVDDLAEHVFCDVFEGLGNGRFAKEAIPSLITFFAEHPGTVLDTAINELGLGQIDETTVRDIIRGILVKNRDLVLKRGSDAVGPLMGDAMKELQGKIDGKRVSQILREEIISQTKKTR